MKRPILKLKFVDFWEGFQETSNYFLDVLSSDFEIALKEPPDVLFYSVFGNAHLNYDCFKIFFTGECTRPNFNECNYSLSFDYSSDPRNYRLPLYALYGDVERLTRPKPSFRALQYLKKSFCCMVVSSSISLERIEFFHRLSLRKFVHSGGRYLNNIGGPIPNYSLGKLQFIRDFKFVMAFENQSYPGYTTEKIVHPMLVNSIPIYWGNPLIGADFNPKSFINANDFGDLEDLAKYVIEVDRDENLYRAILSEPWFADNKINEFVDPNNVRLHLKSLCLKALGIQLSEGDSSPQ